MTKAEHDAMMEAKGTPKVWVVEHAFPGGNIHSRLYMTEAEARAEYDSISPEWFREIYCTWDIWNWTAKQRRA